MFSKLPGNWVKAPSFTPAPTAYNSIYWTKKVLLILIKETQDIIERTLEGSIQALDFISRISN